MGIGRELAIAAGISDATLGTGALLRQNSSPASSPG